jgi:predicted ATPase
MYVDRINIRGFRSFRKATSALVHPDQDFKKAGIPEPRIKNVNLLLGDNGRGKTAFLQAVALLCLGPAVRSSGIYPYYFVRREGLSGNTAQSGETSADLDADIRTHSQDGRGIDATLRSALTIRRREDLEEMDWSGGSDQNWNLAFKADSSAFFAVGYGASRRTERSERTDLGSRQKTSFARAQRLQSLFEDDYTLVPMESWAPRWSAEHPDRFQQVVEVINRIIGGGHYRFTGRLIGSEYEFDRNTLRIPFRALSDGYRAFFGWLADFMYHMCMTWPVNLELWECTGVALIDEIDLHLHPKWQMEVLPKLSKEFPRIQFIVTSHSPLVVGSLEWMNILFMRPTRGQSSIPVRIHSAVHGLDADQV